MLSRTRVAAILVLCVLAGCSAPHPGGHPTDWTAVAPSADGSQIVAWKTIARHCDAWHRGKRPSIDLRYNADGHIEDDAGHRLKVRPEDFKGIVQATRAPGAQVVAFASLSEMYSNGREGIPQDKFGLVPRYKYAVTAPNDDTIRYTIVEKLDGGM